MQEEKVWGDASDPTLVVRFPADIAADGLLTRQRKVTGEEGVSTPTSWQDVPLGTSEVRHCPSSP